MGEDGLGDEVFLGTKDPLGLAAGVDLTLAGLLKLPFGANLLGFFSITTEFLL